MINYIDMITFIVVILSALNVKCTNRAISISNSLLYMILIWYLNIVGIYIIGAYGIVNNEYLWLLNILAPVINIGNIFYFLIKK